MTHRPLDFLVIGAPKAGTTSLFYYLKNHPQIYMPLAKEEPFFSDDYRYSQGWDAFSQEVFLGASPDLLLGKITPQYFLREDVPERIHKFMPSVKLIALLRNPVDRAFSDYRFSIKKGAQLRPFEEEAFDPKKRYLWAGKYANRLSLFLKYFPQDQLLVLFTDTLEQNPQSVLDKIMLYLDLPPGFSSGNLSKRYNTGGNKKRFPWLIPTIQRLPFLKKVWHSLPKTYRKAIGLWFFTSIHTVPEQAPKLPLDLRKKLIAYYKQDVQELELLIGQSVPWREYFDEELAKRGES